MLAQPRSEQRIDKIEARVVQVAESKEFGRGGMPEPRKLRKHEPHPVRLLPAGVELCVDVRQDRVLCCDETLQIVSHFPSTKLAVTGLSELWKSNYESVALDVFSFKGCVRARDAICAEV